MSIGPINFSGLASGLDVNAIIDAIIRAKRRPIDLAKSRQQTLTARKDAFAELRTALTAVRSAAVSLNSAAVVAARTTTISDTTLVSASAGARAAPGTHDVVVAALAAASRVRSAGVADPYTGLVSDGTITLKAGSNATITIDVSAASGNNTLEAVRDAINAANEGVRASIVNDGSAYVLVVESEKTGTANALAVTDTTNLNLDDPGNALATAANASLTVDGIAVSSASNSVSDVIEGVTLDLLKMDPAKTVTLTVARDSAPMKKALSEFIDAYNKAADFFGKQVWKEGESGEPGPLAGDSTVRAVGYVLQRFAVAGVSALPTTVLRSLGQVGVVLDTNTGRLSLDSAAFDKAFRDRPDEFRALLMDSGSSTSGLVSFVSARRATREGAYAVDVTTAAEQAGVTGSTAVSGLGLAADETLTITVGGASTQVTLAAGSTLATIVSAANTALRDAGVDALAEDAGGSLRIRSRAYGSAVSVSVVSDTVDSRDGRSTGIGTSALTDAGVDVAGTIAGVAGVGSGQNLEGAAGTDAEGLSLLVRGSGDLGTITFTRGIASRASLDLASINDAYSGSITAAVSALEDSIRVIDDRVEEMEARLTVQQDMLLKQFMAMEQALETLQAQLNSISGSGSGSLG